MNRRAFLVSGAAAALSGCAALSSFIARDVAPNAARAFGIDARFSLTRGDVRWIGTLTWDFAPRLEKIVLEVAGQSFAVLERFDGNVKATLANGQTMEEPGWRALTARAIGFALPFDAAAFWVRSTPAPDSPVTTHGTDAFSQLGWRVDTLARDAQARASRMRWQSDDITFTLLIDQWRSS